MTDRLRAEAERVARNAQPPEVRGPWLEWNATLIEILNRITLNEDEIKALLQRQNFINTAAIASGLKEYAAGDEVHRAASEASIQAEIAALRQQIVGLATQRADDMTQLRQELDRRHAELLAALSRVNERQARQARQARRDRAQGVGNE
jgi:hypothetical protein